MANLLDFLMNIGNGIQANDPNANNAARSSALASLSASGDQQSQGQGNPYAALGSSLWSIANEQKKKQDQQNYLTLAARNPELAKAYYLANIGDPNASRQTTPAAIQIANEIQKARASGDIQRVNDLNMVAKTMDKGIVYDENGNPVVTDNYASALQKLGYGKKSGETQGQKDVELNMNPSIEKSTSEATVLGKSEGENKALLQDLQANMPKLEKTVNDLSALGKKATYTVGGQVYNQAKRQLGADVGEGAVARKEYISKVDNEILPLLRQTFGAQFTKAEGDSLRSTLGDPNASPEEKDAVLKSFIDNKKTQVQALKRRTSDNPSVNDILNTPSGNIPSNPPSPVTKSIGGKTYIQINGKWFEQ